MAIRDSATETTGTGARALGKAALEAGQSRSYMGALVGVAAVAAFFLLASKIGAGFAIPVGIMGVIGGTAVVILRGPIGRAVARRIDEGGAGGSAEEFDQLHARIDELEAGQSRMAELEERLDFAERLLTRGRAESGVPEQPR